MKPEFKIGDFVEVKAFLHFFYTDKNDEIGMPQSEKTYIKNFLTIPWICQITGAKYKQLGEYSPQEGSMIGYYGNEPEFIPAFLSVKETVFCYTVKQGLLNKDYLVLPDNIKLLEDQNRTLPIKYTGEKVEWTEAWKEVLRNEVKTMPRDTKGRWIKV